MKQKDRAVLRFFINRNRSMQIMQLLLQQLQLQRVRDQQRL